MTDDPLAANTTYESLPQPLTVWMLEHSVQYEASNVIGVFISREIAEATKALYEQTGEYYVGDDAMLSVYEVEITEDVPHINEWWEATATTVVGSKAEEPFLIHRQQVSPHPTPAPTQSVEAGRRKTREGWVDTFTSRVTGTDRGVVRQLSIDLLSDKAAS